ncbi:MAG: glycosyltransferase family 2 protein [Flavobacteriaceae bacterium]|jgi:glycosyltransferase involved in cell wall biosynthesis|nr:glycosyltransferase family 2 protein [Flavobacteriaceae bacterium]
MDTETQISVITPSYNRAHTLIRVYECLKKQTFKDFIWIIMDDGSKDNTRELIESFQKENVLEIQYYYHDNKGKFITVFKGVEKVKTPYFVVIDSDDSWPEDSFQILYDEVSSIENKDEFIAVMGNSVDEDGKLIGSLYPGNGFIGSILEMRYKYKVRGDKSGIFITNTYQKELAKFDYTIYEGKGHIPQSVLYNIYDAKGLKTKFINKNIRNYLKDVNDPISLDNTLWFDTNAFGLRAGYLSFVNDYNALLYAYPVPLIRNIIGYHYYSFINKTPLLSILKDIKNPIFKTISVFTLPFSYVYYLIKTMKKRPFII